MEQHRSQLRHGIRILLLSAIAGANLATIALMLGCCLSTLLSPELHPRLSQAGLLLPVFLGMNLCFVVAWLIVEWKGLVLPLLGMACCWGYIRDYCPINFSGEVPQDAIHLLSYNVAHFAQNETLGLDGVSTADYILQSGADIMFFQEFSQGSNQGKRVVSQLTAEGYEMRSYKNLAIFSRYPFVDTLVYASPQSHSNGSMAWKICLDGDTVLLINSHLQSNQISQEEKAQYGQAIEDYDKHQIKASGKILLSRLVKAASGRAEQTDSICAVIHRSTTKSIISSGDMNDTPISYTYQNLASLLKSTFRESGNGLGISFGTKGFPVRIDHIFVSEDFKSTLTYVDSHAHTSDHHPLHSYIIRKRTPQTAVVDSTISR